MDPKINYHNKNIDLRIVFLLKKKEKKKKEYCSLSIMFPLQEIIIN